MSTIKSKQKSGSKSKKTVTKKPAARPYVVKKVAKKKVVAKKKLVKPKKPVAKTTTKNKRAKPRAKAKATPTSLNIV